MSALLVFDLEVDVSADMHPHRTRTHHVRLAVADSDPTGLGWSRAENEARRTAVAMGLTRGAMVTAVRITAVEA